MHSFKKEYIVIAWRLSRGSGNSLNKERIWSIQCVHALHGHGGIWAAWAVLLCQRELGTQQVVESHSRNGCDLQILSLMDIWAYCAVLWKISNERENESNSNSMTPVPRLKEAFQYPYSINDRKPFRVGLWLPECLIKFEQPRHYGCQRDWEGTSKKSPSLKPY